MKKVLSLLALTLTSGALVVAGVSKNKTKEVKADYESKITVNEGFFTNWDASAGYIGDQNSTFWDEHYHFQAVDTFFCGESNEAWHGTLTSRKWTQHTQYIYFQFGAANNNEELDPVHLNIHYGPYQYPFYNDTFVGNPMLLRSFKIPDTAYNALKSEGEDFEMYIEIVDNCVGGYQDAYCFANFGYLNVNQTEDSTSDALRWFINNLNRDNREWEVNKRKQILENYYLNGSLRDLFLKTYDDISDGFDNNNDFINHWYFDWHYFNGANWDLHFDRAIGFDAYRPDAGTNMPFNKTGNGYFRGWFENDELGGFVHGDNSRYRFLSRPFVVSGTGLVSVKMAGTASLHVVDVATRQDLAWGNLLTFNTEGDQANLASNDFNTVTMVRHVINLEAYLGRAVQLAIADTETGGWSAMYVDELVTNYQTYPGFKVDTFTQTNNSGTFNGYKVDKYINSKVFDDENNPTGLRYVLESGVNQENDNRIINHIDNSPSKEAYDFLQNYYSTLRSPNNEFNYANVSSSVKENLINSYAALSYKARSIVKASTDVRYNDTFIAQWWSHLVDTSKTLSYEFKPLAYSQVKNIVSFETNSGSGTMANVLNIEGTYELPDNAFTPEVGYQFKGWKVNGEGNTLEAGEEINVTDDIFLLAQWEEIPVPKYTVSFDGGIAEGEMQSLLLEEGSTYKLPGNGFIVPEHYSFKGWFVGNDETLRQPDDEIIITADVVIHAQWEENPKYIVSYNANGGSGEIGSVTVYAGTLVQLPECTFEAPAGKRFYKWQFNNELKNPGDLILVEKDEVIKAIWEVIPVTYYTVSFVSNGGSGAIPSIQVEEGSSVSLPECTFLAPNGKRFAGWKVGNDATLQQAGYEFVVTKNVVVSAQWEINPEVTYVISFNANGGTGTMNSVNLHLGEQFTLPECAFVAPEGKKFDSWLVGSVKYKPGQTITISGDTRFDALWVKVVNEESKQEGSDADQSNNESKASVSVFEKITETFKTIANKIVEFFKNLFSGFKK